MIRTCDSMFEVFRHRNDPAAREAYVACTGEGRRGPQGGLWRGF